MIERAEITDRMLHAAVRKAVELKLIPKSGFEDQIVESWEKIKAILQAAMDARDVR